MDTPRTLHDIPVELHHAILANLPDDPKTLKACSLTHSLWSPEARRLLDQRTSLDVTGDQALERIHITYSSQPERLDRIRQLTLDPKREPLPTHRPSYRISSQGSHCGPASRP
ncbi:hypothetical protein BD311DRAFT_748163 [Dichomitus squalens]|uniref:F-box domain-containing protein n=1 Tax=Dichomitus squalens TaxID=114155 RepID=A0A4Q9N0C6_9APHY|nr:hypothetical protein BD311DRAFT_748163 [Dichomitus squalens]